MNDIANSQHVDNKQDQFADDIVAVCKDVERFALHLVRNRSAAKELLSQTVAIVIEQRENIRSRVALKSYMMTVLRRLHYQEKRRSKRYVLQESEHFDELFSSTSSPEQHADAVFLYEALQQLPELYRESLVLAELLEYPHKEIAVIQQSGIAAIKVRIFRAKKMLKKILSDSEYNTERRDVS